MAIHSSILAWRIPWTEETGGLQSVGSPSNFHSLPNHLRYSCYFITFYIYIYIIEYLRIILETAMK